MTINIKNNYLFSSVNKLKGVGLKISKYLKNKKIEKINDLLWSFPYAYTDRRSTVKTTELEVGKTQTVKVQIVKYNFPRIRNLPNKIKCKDDFGEIDLVFFNSREGYIRKILPFNEWVVVSGKVTNFKNRYQITNPDYVSNLEKSDFIQKNIPKYHLTEGISEKSYRKIIEKVLKEIPSIEEWHNKSLIKNKKFLSWRESLLNVHNDEKNDFNSKSYRRLAYDEIFSHLIMISKNRRRIRKNKKVPKKFKNKFSNKILNNFKFNLTNCQEKAIKQINCDLKSYNRMFRIIQGDVGSGKTIVSLIAASNVIESSFQCALMAPTEILARQHFDLAKEIFKDTNIKIAFITGKTEYREKKKIYEELNNGHIKLIIGTHSLFQKNVKFKKLGLIIVDEQHKFGVKQRMSLAKKGGENSDVLLMSATPIPRTMMLTIYGDMDVTKIIEKPSNRKNIITLSKPEEKIDQIFPFVKKQIINGNQVFWVCPLIDDSKFLNYSSVIKRFDLIEKKFPNKVGLIYGSMTKEEKEDVLKKFLNKDIYILISTTVIEVGIDFPNANLIVIENANKFGLAQLHQLRGRVGRGVKQGTCILMFKGGLSKKAIQRIKILKETNDGFVIAEEDMRLRGYGDIIGFQQSGIKYFRIADPIHHDDLFKLAEKEVNSIDSSLYDTSKYDFLLKLFDKAEIISDV